MNSARRSSLAFTVTELLVVITLIVILVLIAVPSFQTMVYSSEEALAESQLRAALRAARDVAVRANGDGDGVAVFFFEPGGRLTIVICAKVGELTDAGWFQGSYQPDASVRREVFAPAPGYTPVVLPKYWMVRGYAPANSLSHEWYGATNTAAGNTDAANWVFPETGFYNHDLENDGAKRSTFMVRFHAGTGELASPTTEPALVFAPRMNATGRGGEPFLSNRADREGVQDPVRFVRKVLARPPSLGNPGDKRTLIGRESSDMVLARPVRQIAAYNETKLAAAFGAPLDRATDCIYASGDQPGYVTQSAHLINLKDISGYMQGDENLDQTVDAKDHPQAKLFSIDRYSGALRQMEVQP